MGAREVAYCQSLVSPRATGVAAFGPIVSDSRGFVANPAGLIGIRDWEFSAVTYFPTGGGASGFVFHGLTLGKKFLERHAVALQFSDGTSLESVFPGQVIIGGQEPTSVETRVSYSEKISLGYAYDASSEFSLGAVARFRNEKITDTQVQFMDTVIILPEVIHVIDSWSIDLGLRWKPTSQWSLQLVGRNLANVDQGSFPETFQSFRLERGEHVTLAAAYRLSPSIVVAGEGNTQESGALGSEWILEERYALRSGLYLSNDERPFVYALGLGLGWTYEFFDVDISYLHFFNATAHSGEVLANDFNPSLITNLDLNPYTRARFSLSVNARFGNVQESLARIENVEMYGGIYPSSHEVSAYRPIGKAVVVNVSPKPIHVRAAFFIENLMDAPTESQRMFISPGEEVEVPLTAVFNEEIKNVSQAMIRDATVSVKASPTGPADDQYQTRVVIHGKNDWDGQAESLRYFVTPDDSAVIRYTRSVLLSSRDAFSNSSTELEAFHKAKLLIETFVGKLVYVNDPKQSSDFVQYPSETLALRGGDCDDLTVCFSSLLNSVGISTALVDVVPPDAPEKSHIYLLFDTGLPPQYGARISENPKRYIVRRNPKGEETIWIPVETTVIAEGFEKAWRTGAEEYFDDVEVKLGLLKGWVRIVDVY